MFLGDVPDIGLQVIETVVGIAVINAAVSKAGPLEDEVFKLDVR